MVDFCGVYLFGFVGFFLVGFGFGLLCFLFFFGFFRSQYLSIYKDSKDC